jgi:hypothetical protein
MLQGAATHLTPTYQAAATTVSAVASASAALRSSCLHGQDVGFGGFRDESRHAVDCCCCPLLLLPLLLPLLPLLPLLSLLPLLPPLLLPLLLPPLLLLLLLLLLGVRAPAGVVAIADRDDGGCVCKRLCLTCRGNGRGGHESIENRGNMITSTV